jgi:GNAT superfamily N-acetyltransferase
VCHEGHAQGLRYLAAFQDQRCVGLAGWRLVATTAGIRKLCIDDLITTERERHTGIGSALLAELDLRARAAGCHLLDFDSGVQRADAHRFYMRHGMNITAFHFVRTLR